MGELLNYHKKLKEESSNLDEWLETMEQILWEKEKKSLAETVLFELAYMDGEILNGGISQWIINLKLREAFGEFINIKDYCCDVGIPEIGDIMDELRGKLEKIENLTIGDRFEDLESRYYEALMKYRDKGADFEIAVPLREYADRNEDEFTITEEEYTRIM